MQSLYSWGSDGHMEMHAEKLPPGQLDGVGVGEGDGGTGDGGGVGDG